MSNTNIQVITTPTTHLHLYSLRKLFSYPLKKNLNIDNTPWSKLNKNIHKDFNLN